MADNLGTLLTETCQAICRCARARRHDDALTYRQLSEAAPAVERALRGVRPDAE